MADGDGVQADEAQGAAPYQEYLDRLPEEVRGQVEPVFKEWDGNVTRRFQEASENRTKWDAYEQTGITDYPPEVAQWATGFYKALDNPQAIQEWFEGYAQEHGLTLKQAEAAVADDLGLSDDLGMPDISSTLEKHLAPISQQLQEINQWRQGQEQQVALQAATNMVQEQLAEVKEELGDRFDHDVIERLAGKYVETDPANAVKRAAQDWVVICNQIEKTTLQRKVDTSGPAAESGGYADGAPEATKTLKEARARAMEMIRANHAA